MGEWVLTFKGNCRYGCMGHVYRNRIILWFAVATGRLSRTRLELFQKGDKWAQLVCKLTALNYLPKADELFLVNLTGLCVYKVILFSQYLGFGYNATPKPERWLVRSLVSRRQL